MSVVLNAPLVVLNDPLVTPSASVGGIQSLIGQGVIVAPVEIQEAVKVALRMAVNNWKRRMRFYIEFTWPKFTGDLIESGIAVLQRSWVRGLSFRLIVGADIHYAAPLNFGRDAAMPPVAPLIEWFKFKGAPNPVAAAWGYAMKIKTKDTTGIDFMGPTVLEARRIIREELERAFQSVGITARVNIR